MLVRIVSIRERGKIKKHICIGLSDGTVLKLNPEIAIGGSFFIGRELSEDDLIALKEKQSKSDAYYSAIRFLTRRAHSRGELYEKLYNKGFNKDNINEALRKLDEQGYINDEEFARVFVRDRIQKAKSGMKLIAAELYKKKVRKEIIDKILDETFKKIDQSDIAYELLQKRTSRYSKYEGRELKSRLYRYLQGRGFNSEDISVAVGRFIEM